MIDLWQVLRVTWLVVLPPEQPSGVGIRRKHLRRGESLELAPEHLAVVLSGSITDRVTGVDGSVGVIRRYAPRDPVILPIGVLHASEATEVLVLLDGWQAALPEASALVHMLTAAELLDTKRRLGSVMTDTVEQRIRAHLLAEDIEPAKASPTVVAQHVACSRESASRVLGQMVGGAT